MSSLNNRFCLVPFSDLTDCPEAVHHAIGSPHFDALGKPLFPDPILIAVRADILDPLLPRCTGVGVSCNTRPYNAYGPVMKKIFEKSEPHKYPEVRRGLEGVMEVGEVELISPGGLSEQTQHLLLGCVSLMTGSTNLESLHKVLQNFCKEFARFPWGSTMRLPIIGTGAARPGMSGEDIFRSTISLIVSYFSSYLLPPRENMTPKKLLLCHPGEYESQLTASMLAEKAVFLTLLDKMNIFTNDSRFIYGLASGEKKENQMVDPEMFSKAIDYFDGALTLLLEGNRREAMQEAARGVELEPNLRGVYKYICSFSDHPEGLMKAVVKEAMGLAKGGRIRDAFCVAEALGYLDKGEKYSDLIMTLREAYMHYSIAAMEARLLYENYMETEEMIQAAYKGTSLSESSRSGEFNLSRNTVRKKLLKNLDALSVLEKKIPVRLSENSFHIIIRKLMAENIELEGSRRTLDNLLDLANHGKVELSEEMKNTCQKLYELLDFIQQNKTSLAESALREKILQQLQEILPSHGTMHLEAGRYYLGGKLQSKKPLTRSDIQEAWKQLEKGYADRPRDYGLLSYLGLLIFCQGSKCLQEAEEFYKVFVQLLDDEIDHGRFSVRELKTLEGEKFLVPHRDGLTKQAYQYYQKYRENARIFARLAKALFDSEGTAAVALYKQAMDSLTEIGRYDLVELYEKILGETWVIHLCVHSKSIGSIPTPFGDISLDFILILYRKVRNWWKYNFLKSDQIQNALKVFIKNFGKKI